MTHQEYLTKVGLEIKIARIRKGMSTKDVSKVTGICTASIGQLERGATDAKILTYKRVADALGVGLNELF